MVSLKRFPPVAAIVVLLASMPARADVVYGVYAGVGVWQQQASGELQSTGSLVDVERDLGLEDNTNQAAYVAVEHPVPALPHLRAQFSGINVNGNEVLSRSIEVNGMLFSFADTVASEVELNQADAVFYYQLLESVLSLDIGFAARWLDGRVELMSTQQSARAEFSGVLPLLYTGTRFNLPLTGFFLGGQMMGMSYDGTELYDLNAQIGYESGLGLGAELGWRSYQLTLDKYDELDRADVEVAGPYLALNYHF